MNTIPADVRARLESEYDGADLIEALELIEALDFGDRVARCVVFLAKGSLLELASYAEVARIDWRDVIFWAEYIGHSAKHPKQVRDMKQPFAQE